MPDPVAQEFCRMQAEIAQLKKEIASLKEAQEETK